MLKRKSAVANHLIIIFIISIFVSLFLFFILDGIYGKEHDDCVKIRFKIEDVCKTGKQVNFLIRNKGLNSVKFSFNDNLEDSNFVLPQSKKTLKYNFKNEIVEIIPFIRTSNKVYFCKSKKQSKNLKIISKKC